MTFNFKLITLTIVCFLEYLLAQNNTQCVENPTGEVSLNVAVRGIPGPEGLQGPQGNAGPQGMKGAKGDRGPAGPIGPTGLEGPTGLPGLEGPVGPRGYPGPDGTRGPQGRPGLPGPRGYRGEPGDTILNKAEFNRVTDNVLNDVNLTLQSAIGDLCEKLEELNQTVRKEAQNGDKTVLQSILAKLEEVDASLHAIKKHSPAAKCGIFGDWKNIGLFDTRSGNLCPSGFRTVTNTGAFQRACGRTHTGGGCISIHLPIQNMYQHICGIVKAFQYYSTDGFERTSGPRLPSYKTIDTAYVDGVSVTQGSPRRHVWSYAAAASEQLYADYRCPCTPNNPNNGRNVPEFVGEHFYCESAFPNEYSPSVQWTDPLWDGKGCVPGNKCCERYGWFYRNVSSSTDNMELRVCGDEGISNEDILLEYYEIWVL